MANFFKKPIELPTSGPVFTAIAIIAVVSMVSNLLKDNKYIGYYLLTISIMTIITGIAVSFSKKERERTRAKALAELPERAAFINAPDADRKTRRRGYYLLVIGIALFAIWSWIFGLSSLAAGV